MVTASALHDLPKGITSTEVADRASDTRNIHLRHNKGPAYDCNIPDCNNNIPGVGGCGG
jgi:hypothetical protein